MNFTSVIVEILNKEASDILTYNSEHGNSLTLNRGPKPSIWGGVGLHDAWKFQILSFDGPKSTVRFNLIHSPVINTICFGEHCNEKSWMEYEYGKNHNIKFRSSSSQNIFQ